MKILPITSLAIVLFTLVFYAIGSNSVENINSVTVSSPLSKEDIEKMAASKHLDSIVLGAGCFWGAEKRYEVIPGVINAISGYADGKNIEATYKAITDRKNRLNTDNHAEVVEVTFNSSLVSLETILQSYFEGHDPTQLNRQGNDVGTQYRSTILTNSQEQLNIANKVSEKYQSLLFAAQHGKIQTKIKPLTQFYPAEEYHQNYLVKNPDGYCPDHSTGITFDTSAVKSKSISNQALLKGKHIVVIESAGYCPYCEKFKKNVADSYQGTIPLTYRLAHQLDGLTIKSPTWATPTVLFIKDGKEVFGKQGYMEPIDFYKALGVFKLGKGESYNVAFNEGTDGQFCKQYAIFKNTPDGVFIDKLSGAQLFDTRFRFNSKSGWLSFTKPVEGSVYQKQDHRYGMQRVEIRSKTSGIHLGHIFPDGPNGGPRYCINATVLEFVPRDQI